MATKTKGRKPKPSADAEVTPARPAPPEPGYWKPTQTMRGKVLQYAWTCPGCRQTEYVLTGPQGVTIEVLKGKLERCVAPGGCRGRQYRLKDDRTCRRCGGERYVCSTCTAPPSKCTGAIDGKCRGGQLECSACEATGVRHRTDGPVREKST